MSDSVRKGQTAVLAFFIPIVFKISVLPSYLYGKCGPDCVFVAFFLIVFEFLHFGAITAVRKLGGIKGIEEYYGKAVAFFLTLPLYFSCLLKLTVFAVGLTDYVSYFLFYNVNHFGVKTVLFLAIFYIAVKGARAVGRLAELTLAFIPLIVFMGLGFGKSSFNADYLLPLGMIGFGEGYAVFDSALFFATDLTPLLFTEEAKTALKSTKSFPYVPVAVGLSIVALTTLFVAFTGNYGGAAPLVDHAFARLASFNVVNSQVGSLEWPSVLLWLVVAVLFLSLNAYACGKIGSVVVKNFRFNAGFAAAVALVLIQTAVPNVDSAMSVAVGGARYYAVAADWACVTVALALSIARKRRAEGASR